MTKFLRLASAASVALMLGASSGAAAIIDFTNDAVSTGPGTEGGGWVLTGNPVAPNTNEAGPGAVGPLVGDNDGLGIKNDEISGDNQFITITFNETVKLTGLFFLDLYISATNGDNYETALVSKGAAPAASANASVVAQEVNDPDGVNPGFAYQAVSLTGTQFTFSVGLANPGLGFGGTGNDDSGQRDYALAGIEISAVPLPAGMLLFGSALGGLGLMRRRKQK